MGFTSKFYLAINIIYYSIFILYLINRNIFKETLDIFTILHRSFIAINLIFFFNPFYKKELKDSHRSMAFSSGFSILSMIFIDKILAIKY